MSRKLWAGILLFTVASATISAQSPQGASQSVQMGGMEMEMAHARSSIPAGPLKITFGDKSAEWTPGTLAALPHITLAAYNEHIKAAQAYSGVELIELLKPLGVPDKPHGKEFRLYLVAECSDG